MFNVNQDEAKELKSLCEKKVCDVIRDILKRELIMQHKLLENDADMNATFISKGRCQAIRSLYVLLKKDTDDVIDNYAEVEVVSENNVVFKKRSAWRIIKILVKTLTGHPFWAR